jgi:phenylacetate-CoA ligase
MIPVPIRYGKVFRETYAFLQESQWWSKEQLEEYQLEQLSKLLEHAYVNVPYYRGVFDERGLKPKDIQDLKDLQQLPYLTKEDVKSNFNELIARNADISKCRLSHTSGSTGKPLSFYINNDARAKEWAFITFQWSRVGYNIGEKRIVLRGDLPRRGFYEYDPVNKALILSSSHITEKNLNASVEIIDKSGIRFIHAYPGAIGIMAKLMNAKGIRLKVKPKAILCASEQLYDWQKKAIKEAFECLIFSHYGLAEMVALGGWCEKSEYYHILPQYGVTEIINLSDNEKNTGEIVATNFLNYAMPFIRYKTGDIAKVSLKQCACGRYASPLIESIEGRSDDFIITSDGRYISPTVLTFAFETPPTVKESQIIQEDIGILRIKIVPYKEAKKEEIAHDTEYITQELKKRIGADEKFIFEYVDAIPRGANGKFRWIISKPAREYLREVVEIAKV